MQSLNLNLISLNSQRNLSEARSTLGVSVERLSSGLRINRAKDDVAGLGISQELQRQIGATSVASRNAADAISMVQMAEGSLSTVSDLLLRMKELSVKGANQSLSKEQRKVISSEISQLRNEINAIATRTDYNGLKLLTGNFKEAQQGRFDTSSVLVPASRAALIASTIEEGDASATVAGKSVVRFGEITVSGSQAGSYQLTNNGAVITLSRTDASGAVARQSLTLTTSTPKSRNEVALADAAGETTRLDFFQLGVLIDVVNTTVGSDHTASEIATKIVGIGTVVNESIKNAGWTSVAGADWATGSGTLKAVITSSGGEIRTTLTSAQMDTLGLSSVSGYAARGVSALPSGGDRYEMAFTGSASALNAVLATLQVDNKTGLGDIVVEIVPSTVSVFTNPETGITSYYYVETSNASWDSARAAALAMVKTDLGLPSDYDNGYLANVTSAAENAFLTAKLNADSWMGASDNYQLINASIAARNADIAAGQIIDETVNATSYANQAAAEGYWYWIDGPERGLMFFNDRTGRDVSGQPGQVTADYRWSNWAVGEPNDSGSTEHYAQFYSSNKDAGPPPQSNWNDLPETSSLDYIVEFGGYKGVYGNTSKTILLGTPGTISVGNALSMTSLSTEGAEKGIYKVSASELDKTVTLKRFDVDGETLLQTETIDIKDQASLKVGQYKTLNFERLGVSFDLQNLSDYAVAIGSAESGFSREFIIASSQMVSAVSDRGPLFQVGEASRQEFTVTAFRDIRLGKNEDIQSAVLFNEADRLISSLDAANDPGFAEFQTLEGRLGDVMTEIASRRSALGILQNRLESAIANIGEQYANLKAANSQILDTDFAAETARLTRMQIGQQAATAMLAQANQVPNVILALLQ